MALAINFTLPPDKDQSYMNHIMQKNIFNRILYLVVLLFVLNFCENMMYDNLKNIESYIDNRPDSAMANICLIDTKK